MEIEHFLELVTKNPLDKKEVIAFYDIVKGIIPDLLSEYKGYRIVHNHDKYHRYYVPLTDDLVAATDEDIIESIMVVWEEVYAGKYYIETSTIEDEEPTCECPCTCGIKSLGISISVSSTESGNDIDPREYSNQLNPVIKDSPEIDLNDYSEAIALSIAKYQHKKWVNEKLKEGWKFSTEYDFIKKEHPLLVNWEQLPVEYQNVDENFLSEMTAILDGMDLQLVHKSS